MRDGNQKSKIKNQKRVLVCFSAFILLGALVSGCASIKEAGKGFLGVSTKVLEDTRKEAYAKEFKGTYADIYKNVKDILKFESNYVYAEDTKTRMIAIYVTETDTTPVGIFLTEVNPEHVRIEVSSPSTPAKELISNKIFGILDGTDKLGGAVNEKK